MITGSSRPFRRMNKNKREASVQRKVTMGNALRQDGKERQVEIIDDEDDEIEEISKVFVFRNYLYTGKCVCFRFRLRPPLG